MWKYILSSFLLIIITYIVYNLLKVFILEKIKINKWFILAASIIVIIAPAFINFTVTGFWSYLQSFVTLLLFLWFFDRVFFENQQKKANNKNIKIKPKAKPNRIKNLK